MFKRVWLIAFAVMTLAMAGMPASTAGEAAPTVKPAVVESSEDDAAKQVVPAEIVETERYVVEFAARPDLGPAHDIADFRERGEFVVRALRETADRSQRVARDFVEQRGIRADSFWFRNVMIVEADAELAAELAQLEGVTAVRPERIYPLVRPVEQGEPVEVNASDPEWGLAKIRADKVWDEGILGGGVVVANIDTGVDYTHEALDDQYRGNLGGGDFSHDYNWWDPTGICGDTPCDNADHGTHTMGTIVGGDGPGPFTPDIGVAPGAQWIAAKGCEDFGCSEFALLSAGQFVLAPTDLAGENPDPSKRPDIVNNSWGGPPGDPFYLETVENWRAAGIIPVFSTGNPGPFCGEGGSPGDFNETFSAGATDIDDVIAEFSGRGPSAYGKINPNVTAPGVDVVSSIPGDGYAAFSGTSMAAPHVTGTLALLMSAAPDLLGDFDGATGPIAQTAVDIIDLTCGGADDGDPNNVYGEGRIDAYAAVTLVATGGTLQGTVTDLDTGGPVAAARIEATADDRTYAVTADEAGAYSMFLPAGDYVVSASAFAYETAVAAGIVIVTDVTTTQDFAIEPLPSATISGRVLRAETGRPVEGAEVAALGTPLPPAVTGRDGGYSLTLPIGSYTLEASIGRCLTVDQVEVDLFEATVRNFSLAQVIDDFGYGCELIPYRWVDAQLPAFVYGDDQTGRMPMPFDFPFYGDDYDTLYVASNGYVTFEDEFFGWSDYYNRPLPDQWAPNAGVYALWQDLWVYGDAHVDWDLLERAGRKGVVIEYANVPRLGSEVGADFEILLWDDGTIDLMYGDSIDNLANGAEATIGIENAAGDDALMYSHREAVIDAQTGIRFFEVPAGIVSGTVTDANDGLPVAGVTVTADPTDRQAVTDGDGMYSLKLLPGSYTIAYEADGYDPASRVARLRADQVLTIDVELVAPVVVVEPTELIVLTDVDVPAVETVTISNAGSAQLDWELRERETGVAPPELPPVTERIVWLTTDSRPAIPDDFEPNLTDRSTFNGPLDEIISDPEGDAQSTVDVIAVNAGADDVEVSFEVVYSGDTPMEQAIGTTVFLDVDQDPATGLPPEWLAGLPTQDVGIEYFVDLWLVFDGIAIVVDENFEVVAEVAAENIGQTFRFDIPLEVLGGDDGAMNVAMEAHDWDFLGQDWAPDVGHGTVEPYRDATWMAGDPATGSLLPGESTDVTVTLGGEGHPAGEYTGILVFVTNDPRQSAHEVDVSLSIDLPEDFGGLEGVVTNSRSGDVVPANVEVEAERDGDPYPVAVSADPESGGYQLFAPAGTWPVTASGDGYGEFTGDVTIAAGALATYDIALDPLWPFATLEGGPIEVEIGVGETATAQLTLGNVDGLAPLEFEIFELDGSDPGDVEAVEVTRPGSTAPTPSNVAPDGHEATLAETRVAETAQALMFMDALPWDSEALLIAFEAYDVDIDVRTSGDMATIDLAQYDLVLIANDQPQPFYDAYHSSAERFADFVAGGGLLWFGAAGSGWNGGYIGEALLPGGVTVVPDVFEGANEVVVPDHPLVWNLPSPFFGDAASHSAFDSVPEGSVIAIGSDSGLPTLLDYDHGAGKVLAFGQTLEFSWEYGGDPGLILDNAVQYALAFQPFTDLPWLDVDPASGSVDVGASLPIDVLVDAGELEPGVYTAEIVVVTNDPMASRLAAPVTLTVTG